MSGPPNLSDRPLGSGTTLEQVIWFLDRQLVPFVRRIRAVGSIIIDWIVPGNDGEVLKTEGGVTTWGLIEDANVAPAADVAVTKLAAGAQDEVLVSDPVPTWKTLFDANINALAAILVSKLAPGTDGQIIETVAGVPTWVTPSTGGGSWVTLYEPDLLNHSSFTYGSDTNHAVDGVNIWAKNTASGTISIGAAANQGIKIAQTGATGFFFNSTPFVYIEFPDMAALAYGDGPFRIQVQYELVAGFTGVQFQNEIGMGIGSETGIPAAWSMCMVRKGAGAGTTNQDTLGAYSVNGASTALETTTSAVGSNDVATMLFYPPFSAEYAFSAYSGGYNQPTYPQSKLFFWQTGSAGVPGFTMNANGGTNVNGYQVVLGINTGNGGSTLGTVYFKRLRVQQWVAGY